ncbi:MAG TPA: hypothetical protein VGV64_00705 [Thermoplasmata archaeon]|nr:hypothetical protein [Thermoplasmata archaeon]
MPRRTRQTVHRRLANWGWFQKRLVPDLALAGAARLNFALVEPFEERRSRTHQVLRRVPRMVVLWAGTELIFAVYASTSTAPVREAFPGLEGSLRPRASWTLSASPSESGVPVYFDFEASWVRRWGLPGCRSYPQPYPVRSMRADDAEGEEPSPPTAAEIRLAKAMVTGGPEAIEGPASRVGSIGSLRRRRLERDALRRRTFLDPVAVHRSIDGFPPQIVFLHGRLRPDVAADAPLHDLLGKCSVGPFLYASDGREVLMGALSMGPGMQYVGGPVRPAPVLPTLGRSLREIEVRREPLESLKVLVDHDYGRLFDPGDAVRDADAPHEAEAAPITVR